MADTTVPMGLMLPQPVMGKDRFDGCHKDPAPEDPCARLAGTMELRRTDPVVDWALSSWERRSTMRMAIASSNPHKMTPHSSGPHWLESYRLLAMPGKADDF
ncbi:hypothetical protein D1007_52450 [Hordeum vulgare]|nr:hypothetical protein D1007_52450 [Hordeum vulgare]